MNLPKKLKEKRDDGAKIYDYAMACANDNAKYFNAVDSYTSGFSACYAELAPLMKEMAEALDRVQGSSGPASSLAEEPLVKYRELMGEE